MLHYLFFRILLVLNFISELSVNGCELEVRQPQKLLIGKLNQSLSLSCNVNMSSCTSNSPEVVWYMFTSDSHHQLDTTNQVKYNLENHQLQINQLMSRDDGVYYCAVAFTDQNTAGAFGSGTTVIVKDHDQYTGRAVLLALLVLLALYFTIVLAYTICIKTGRGTSFLNGRSRRNDSKIDPSKKVHFGAVMQELYSKRNFRKKSVSGDVSPQIKIENPHSQTEREGIYQNLKRTG